MGGGSERCHVFSEMGPIYKAFLTKAGFDVTLTENRDDFCKDKIAPYDLIIDYTTEGDLTEDQSCGLLNGIIAGKGFIGIHSAADSFKNTPGYISMLGGKFLTHPKQQPLTFNIKNHHHPVTKGLNDFEMVEELYLMETIGHFDLLMSTWYDGFEHPITWVKPYGHGRVLYTAFGHGKEQTEHPHFQQLIINGVHWVCRREN